MYKKKACVVFTEELEYRVKSVAEHLANEGYDICTALADLETVEAAQNGSTDLPEDVKICIDNASVCVFLVPQTDAQAIAAAAGYAGRLGTRIIAICENVSNFPAIFDELADSLVNIDNPKITDAIKGDKVWEGPNGESGNKRDIERVKCQ